MAAVGAVLVTVLLAMGVVRVARSMNELVAGQRALVGRTAVVVGEFASYDDTAALPMVSSRYRVRIPDDAPVPEAGETVELAGDEDWGFPPSTTFPPRQDYLLSFRHGTVEVMSRGDEGTLHAVSPDDVDAAILRRDVAVGLGMLVTLAPAGLTAMVVVSTRRRRPPGPAAPPA